MPSQRASSILPFAVDLVALADATPALASRAASALGFRRSSGDWRGLLTDPEIDVINIAAPNALHREMALAAIAAGKHVYCEKPLAPTSAEAREMAEAAAAAGIVTQGRLSTISRTRCSPWQRTSSRAARSAPSAASEASMPRTIWPMLARPGHGGSTRQAAAGHWPTSAAISLPLRATLLGPISSLMADARTVVPERPAAAGMRAVEVDDVARLFVGFESGASGSLEANWIATGRKMQHDFEVYGDKGAILFTQERFNELQIYDAGDKPGRRGFRTVLAAPEHEPYGAFCVAPGHQLGFNDLKAIEVRGFLQALAGGPEIGPGFAEGYEIQKLVDLAYRSAREKRWMDVK